MTVIQVIAAGRVYPLAEPGVQVPWEKFCYKTGIILLVNYPYLVQKLPWHLYMCRVAAPVWDPFRSWPCVDGVSHVQYPNPCGVAVTF